MISRYEETEIHVFALQVNVFDIETQSTTAFFQFSEQADSKCAIVYGQMNEPPGARARVGLTGLTVAEHFRDAEGQDVLLFIDNIFRFTQASLSAINKALESCLDWLFCFADTGHSLFLICRLTQRCLPCLVVSHLLYLIFSPFNCDSGDEMTRVIWQMIKDKVTLMTCRFPALLLGTLI